MATWQAAIAQNQSEGDTDSDGTTMVSNLESTRGEPQAGAIIRHADGNHTVLNEDTEEKLEDIPEEQVESALDALDIANSDWS